VFCNDIYHTVVCCTLFGRHHHSQSQLNFCMLQIPMCQARG